jgi:hypothetical protein
VPSKIFDIKISPKGELVFVVDNEEVKKRIMDEIEGIINISRIRICGPSEVEGILEDVAR